MSKDKRFRLGISHGDVNGISYEVILKSLTDQRMLDFVSPVVYGSSKVASYHRKTIRGGDINFQAIQSLEEASNKRINILNVTEDDIRIELGIPSTTAGEMAVLALEKAVDDLIRGDIDALVTAPIDKKTAQSEAFNFKGHTEYLASRCDVKEYLMFMVSPQLRIGVVTGHIPINTVSAVLTPELIASKLKLMHDSLVRDFGIARPRIAVMGLNPHASDNGLLGSEEQDVIIPVIEKHKAEGLLVFGPYPADGFFGAHLHKRFDGILAMYHDQGLIPFKMSAFHDGVNFTAGLPIIRTSPVHGTGYDIAGKDMASPDSMRQAIYLAHEIFENRAAYDELKANAMRSRSAASNNQ